MLHKFGSNWDFKTNGDLVILVNSSHRSHLIAGCLLLGSRRACGRPQLCAGAGKALSWLPLASWPAFIARASPPFFFSLPLLFQSPPPLLRRARIASSAQTSLGKASSELRLLLAHPANRPWSLDFAVKRRSSPFFLTAGSATVMLAPSWPALSGEPFLVLSVPSTLP